MSRCIDSSALQLSATLLSHGRIQSSPLHSNPLPPSPPSAAVPRKPLEDLLISNILKNAPPEPLQRVIHRCSVSFQEHHEVHTQRSCHKQKRIRLALM